MKKALLVLSALAVALTLVLVWWFADTSKAPGSAGPGEAAAQSSPAPAAQAELAAPASGGVPALSAQALEAPPGVVAPRSEPLARRDAGGAPLLAGRLVPPADMPADEVVSVEVHLSNPAKFLLFESAASGAPHESVEVGADGRFELHLPPETAEFWTLVRGRYLLAAAQRFELPLERELRLEPQLGAWISGRLVPPRGFEPDPDESAWEAELSPDRLALLGMGNPMQLGGSTDHPQSRQVEVDRADGFAFELRGVRPSDGYTLAVVPELLAAAKTPPFDAAAGQHVLLELPLVRGGTLSGRVVDTRGLGVAEAEIEVTQDPFMYGQGGFEVREGESDETGAFALAAVKPGKLLVKVTAGGYLDKSTTVELAEGQALTGLEVVLDSGSRIAGRVRWPDGTPAAEVEVDVSFDPSFLGGMEAFNAMRGASGEAETDPQGRFVVSGLGKGPFLVRAKAERETDREQPGVEQPGVEWRARASAVRPGAEDLELVLEPPLGVAGRVVDDLGAPVSEFTVYARTKTSGMIVGLGAETASEHFEDEAGSFFLEGLRAGEWELFASQPGYGQGAITQTVMPLAEGQEVVLALERAASVTGVVLDPDGAPVAGARVGRQTKLADLGRMAMQETQSSTATTDEEGRFLVEGLSSGSHDLVAQATDFAPSAPTALELVPAERVEGVVMTLRKGGRILGVIFDDEGDPWPGQTVLVQDPTLTSGQRWESSDGKGEFVFDDLAPGSYQVMTFPRGGEAPAGGEDSDGADFAAMFADMKFAMAEVTDGEDTFVELGAKPADPVQINGRVVAAGEPVEGTMVSFFADGEDGFDALKFASTDRDGRFTLQLGRPGRYMINVQQMIGTGQQQSVEMLREIPEAEEHDLLLELPVGSIAGLVRGPDGRPLAGARVSLAADGPIANGSFTGGNYAEIWTGADGRYELRWLRPGEYSVSAGGSLLGGLFGDTGEVTYGRQVRRGIAVEEGRAVSGVDFRLETPGSIAGRVTDLSGQPVAEAAIFLRDEEGNPIDRISMVQTATNGRFEYGSLEPGSYQVSARAEGLVTSQPVIARVREGQTSDVELSLDGGTMLVVSLSDAEGNFVRCRVEVTDSEGHQVNGLWSLKDLMKTFTGGGFSTDEQRVGPLPAGKYRIEATADDGRDARKTVTLAGQEERPIRLRLD